MIPLRIKYLADHLEMVPKIAGWFYREWRQLIPGYTLDDVIKKVSERIHKNKMPLALLAYQGKELIGTAALKKIEFYDKPLYSPWLAGVYVKESHREAGIGSHLVSAIEKKAIDFGFKKIYLHTPGSVDFYQKLGWQVVEHIIFNRNPVTIMFKNLSDDQYLIS